MSSDAVVVPKRGIRGVLPPYPREPVSSLVAVSKFDTANFFSDSPVRLSAGIAAGAVPAAAVVALDPEPERCRFDKSTYHFCQLGLAFSFRAAAVQLLQAAELAALDPVEPLPFSSF